MSAEILALISHKVGFPEVDQKEIKDKPDIGINEIAGELCWIYRALGKSLL